MIDRDHNTGQRFAWLALIWVATTATTVCGSTSTIQLHDRATVDGHQIHLSDVAHLEGDQAAALRNILVGTIETGDRPVTITLDQLRMGLSKHVANWGKVTLRGYTACRVDRLVADPTPAATIPTAPPATNPIEEVSLSTVSTLRDRVVEMIQQLSGIAPADLRVEFVDNDREILAQNDHQGRLEIEPMSSTLLGRVPVVIRRYRDGRLVDTHRVTGEIAQRHMAVVAKNGVGRGQTFAPSDVEIQEVYLDNNADQVFGDLSQVIGRVAGSVVRSGAVVRRHQLRSPLLVRRGDLITVRCLSNGLVIKTVGRATEDGALDQLIHVRNDLSRQQYAVRVTGPQMGVTQSSVGVATPGPATKQPQTPRSAQR